MFRPGFSEGIVELTWRKAAVRRIKPVKLIPSRVKPQGETSIWQDPTSKLLLTFIVEY
jgi:hypothetical protein